jgi:hypothetical protein
MVESIYFLKPAWCGTHFAGLRPEQGLQPVTKATALRRWFVTQQKVKGMIHGIGNYMQEGHDRKFARLRKECLKVNPRLTDRQLAEAMGIRYDNMFEENLRRTACSK